MAKTTPIFSRKDDESLEAASAGGGFFCLWNLPCLNSPKSENWERIPNSDQEHYENIDERWWVSGSGPLKKIRKWSELVAGPRWKKFIRRFKKTTGRSKSGKSQFQYDPMSYALNFDDGQLEYDCFFHAMQQSQCGKGGA